MILTLLGGAVAVGLVGVGIALHYAKSADTFADKCHGRMNGAMEKFSKLERLAERIEKLEYEVLGKGRSGVYPDMGLRDWAREWRGWLRSDVAALQGQVPTVSRVDIESLDKRIDTVSELRFHTDQDLQRGKKAHNDLAAAMAALVRHLDLEYTTDNTYVEKARPLRKR